MNQTVLMQKELLPVLGFFSDLFGIPLAHVCREILLKRMMEKFKTKLWCVPIVGRHLNRKQMGRIGWKTLKFDMFPWNIETILLDVCIYHMNLYDIILRNYYHHYCCYYYFMINC